MNLVQMAFYAFALLTVGSAVMIFLTKNVLHAVFSLLGVFLGVSAMYVFAGADFLAVAQLVVYVGGVLVLLLFAVMLTGREGGVAYPASQNKYLISGLISGAGILTVLIYLVIKNADILKVNQSVYNENSVSTVRILGINLMSEYLLVFEVVGVLLLVALIGASFVAGRKEIKK